MESRLIKFLKQPANLLFLSVFFIFVLKGFIFLDPDFGWRLKAGEIYTKYGIPQKDPFSYTMPTFPWVDHAWSQSLFYYLAISRIGYLGLAVAVSFIAYITLRIISQDIGRGDLKNSFNKNVGFIIKSSFLRPFFVELSYKNIGEFCFFPFLLGASIFITFFGMRVQIASWLMASVEFIYFLYSKNWERRKFLLPLLFFLWANLHGSFAMGLASLYIFVLLRTLRMKKIVLSDWVVIFISSFIVLINPYGVGLIREVWSSVTDNRLRFTIAEWMPSLLMLDLAVISFIGISLSLLVKYRKKFTLEEKGLYFFFLFSAVFSRRHLPLMVIVTLPLVVKAISFLWLDAKRVKKGQERFGNFYKSLWLFSLFVFFIQLFFTFREAYFLGYGGFYPRAAVSKIKQNPPKGEIFSEYGWGGYFIWNLPGKRVFIDGRMPSWRWNIAPQGELVSAFDIYNDIISGKVDYKEVFNDYNIEVVIWSKAKEKNILDNLFDKLESSLSVFGWKKSEFDFLMTLESDKWEKIYEDEVAVVYKRP